MSKLIISEERWAAMDEAERIVAVREGHANMAQIRQSTEEGSDELREACEDWLSKRRSATEEMMKRATTTRTEAFSQMAAQALKDLNRRLSHDPFYLGSAVFENSSTAKSAIERPKHYGRSMLY